MSRLGSADTTYEFLRRALGWSVVLQVVWIFGDEIPTETLASMHKWLGQGRLPAARRREGSRCASALGAHPAPCRSWCPITSRWVRIRSNRGRVPR